MILFCFQQIQQFSSTDEALELHGLNWRLLFKEEFRKQAFLDS